MVVKYRRKVINDPISERAKEIWEYIAPRYGIVLEEWNHDIDHVHVMFRAQPKTELSNLYQLKDKYPATYLKVEEQLESGWEGVIRLMEQGMRENVIRPINPHIVKTMMEATIGQFFQRDVLIINGISYNEALEEVVDILVDGILVND